MDASDCQKSDKCMRFHPQETSGGGTSLVIRLASESMRWENSKSCSFLWIPSSCGFQILAQDEKFLSPPLPFLGCVFSLLDTFCWAEDTPFGKLCDHHKPSRNANGIFSDKEQAGMCGKHTPNLWLLLPFSTCLSLSHNSVTIKRNRLGTPNRRMHSQKTSVVHHLSVLERDTVQGSWQRGDKSSLCLRPWQPSLTCHFLVLSFSV